MANKVNLDVSEVLDITCRQGDTFELTLTLKDSSGSGLNLSTDKYSFVMQVWPTGRKGSNPIIASTEKGLKGRVLPLMEVVQLLFHLNLEKLILNHLLLMITAM